MRYDEYNFLQSEVNTLTGMLEKMPDSMVVERIGLEYRLRKTQARLEDQAPPLKPMLAYARIPMNPGQAEPGMEPAELSAALTAAACATGGALRVRSIHDNLITFDVLTEEAHAGLRTAIPGLEQQTGAQWDVDGA